jgi:tRNA G46 methylase TrmB
MRAILGTLRLPSVQHGHYYEWKNIFPPLNDIWIEVLGFGRGENLLALAHRMQNDPVSLIRIEMHQSGIGTTCQRVLKGLEIGEYWSEYTLYPTVMSSHFPSNKGGLDACEDFAESAPNKSLLAIEASISGTDTPKDCPYRNLRLWPGDGVKVLPKFPESSIASLLLTFPDPFPEDREAEWRVVQLSTLEEIYRTLRKTLSRPGRFFLATDHEGYQKWSLECVELFNKDGIMLEPVEPCPDRLEWLPVVSQYEQKGWDEGRQTHLCCWVARIL